MQNLPSSLYQRAQGIFFTSQNTQISGFWSYILVLCPDWATCSLYRHSQSHPQQIWNKLSVIQCSFLSLYLSCKNNMVNLHKTSSNASNNHGTTSIDDSLILVSKSFFTKTTSKWTELNIIAFVQSQRGKKNAYSSSFIWCSGYSVMSLFDLQAYQHCRVHRKHYDKLPLNLLFLQFHWMLCYVSHS